MDVHDEVVATAGELTDIKDDMAAADNKVAEAVHNKKPKKEEGYFKEFNLLTENKEGFCQACENGIRCEKHTFKRQLAGKY